MSFRSRRPDDQDRSHSSHKYDKYQHRHRRDDSRDRDRDRDCYHSKKSSRPEKSRSRYRSRSLSPSYDSKGHPRQYRSRSRSAGHSSRNNRSRSRSPGHKSRHHDDYHRPHRSKDYKELPESKSKRDSREKYGHQKSDVNKHIPKSTNYTMERGSMNISNQNSEHSYSNDYDDYDVSEEPKSVTLDPDAVLEEERKQRIQQETLKRLQKHLEAEGKKYPPARPQASHPIYANDGSFLEMFKSMQGNLQQQQQQHLQQSIPTIDDVLPKKPVPTTSTTNPINRFQPINKRRGAKILKTGIVQKQRIIEETDETPNDSWNTYLKEVKKYKTVTCSDDTMTRSLVK